MSRSEVPDDDPLDALTQRVAALERTLESYDTYHHLNAAYWMARDL
jgi:hypothetical protein